MNIKRSRYLIYLFAILLLLSTGQLKAERPSLKEDINDGYLDDYSKVEAAFILSGITDPDSLTQYVGWYNDLLEKVESFPFEFNDPVGSARTVFMYLHSSWLKTYALESTTLADIARNKEYNCVAATILYNLLCEDLGWSCEAFETPTHVYTIFKNFGDNLVVENTSSMGFDIMKNLQEYSKYLAQYYPQSEVLRIGLDKLYYHENSKGRKITNTELLGLLAYNRAYLAKKNNDFKKAYDFVLLAQDFNRDSRSNVNFEVGLYYAWGRKLFINKKFSNAFSVYADGYYRYPENEDFLKNTKIAFYKSMEDNWYSKSWPESARLIRSHWMQYFKNRRDQKSMDKVKELFNNFNS
ncbi:MAG: hypothetical protein P8X42_09020 [Calditrichaceae bacterium]